MEDAARKSASLAVPPPYPEKVRKWLVKLLYLFYIIVLFIQLSNIKLS